MKGFYTILLLIVSNVFMTFAWYGHLKMKQEYSWFAALPLIGVIAFIDATKRHSRGNNTCYFYSVHYHLL